MRRNKKYNYLVTFVSGGNTGRTIIVIDKKIITEWALISFETYLTNKGIKNPLVVGVSLLY